VTCLPRPQRRRQSKTSLLRAILRPTADPQRAASSGTAPDLTTPGARIIQARGRQWPSLWVPQGPRDLSPSSTVLENLQTRLSPPLKRGERVVPDEIYTLFPRPEIDCCRRRGGDLSGGKQQQLAIARRRLVMKPRSPSSSTSRPRASNPRSSREHRRRHPRPQPRGRRHGQFLLGRAIFSDFARGSSPDSFAIMGARPRSSSRRRQGRHDH